MNCMVCNENRSIVLHATPCIVFLRKLSDINFDKLVDLIKVNIPLDQFLLLVSFCIKLEIREYIVFGEITL